MVTASAVVLMLALVGSGWMLLEAKRTLEDSDRPAETRIATEHAEQERARLFSSLARVHLASLPRSHDDVDSLRAALERVTDEMRRTPHTPSGPARRAMACIAIERSSESADLIDWTLTPLDDADREWVGVSLAALVTQGLDGQRHRVESHRVRGVAYRAVLVGERAHATAIYWIVSRDAPSPSDD